MLAPWKKSYDNLTQHVKKQRHHFANKHLTIYQSYGFFPVVMYVCELDHKEGWAPKNWCFQIVVLEKTLESPLDCKEIKWINPEGNQPWIFTGRTDAEVPILWPPDVKNWLIWKRPWCWKRLKAGREGTTEDEMVGWHHWLDGQEFEQVLGGGDGQGSLACCSPWDQKVLRMTEQLNWILRLLRVW